MRMKFCGKCGSLLVFRMIDGRERLCCANDGCDFVLWNNPIPVVGIIVENEDGIVLAHNKLAPPGIFSIITGFLEAAEGVEVAAIRELKEELGLDAYETQLIGIYPFERANQIIVVYHIVARGNIRLNDELDDYTIVKRSDLLGYNETNEFQVGLWLEKLTVLK